MSKCRSRVLPLLIPVFVNLASRVVVEPHAKLYPCAFGEALKTVLAFVLNTFMKAGCRQRR